MIDPTAQQDFEEHETAMRVLHLKKLLKRADSGETIKDLRDSELLYLVERIQAGVEDPQTVRDFEEKYPGIFAE